MTALTSAITSCLIDFAWQGILLACLLWLVLFILRNASPQTRYLASCLALLTMLVVPIVTAYLAFHPTVAGPALPALFLLPDNHAPALSPAMPWLLWIHAWALPAWSLGVLFFATRLIRGCWQLSRFQRCATPVSETIRRTVDDLAARLGITRTVRLLTSALADSPGVTGIVRPVILLPASSLTGLTPQQLETVLAHELAHIRRHDPLVNALQILIETLLFYHPAVWWVSARIRHERELCCDDLALSCCGDALCYARALTALEKLRGLPTALVLGSNNVSLLYRIRRILGESPRDYSPSKLSGILALALAIACLAVNISTRIQAQDLPKPKLPPVLHESPGVHVDAADVEVAEPIRYPRAAAQKAIQGTVLVQVDVDVQGNVTDARVLSGPPELRKAALQSLLTWRFKSDGTASTRQVSVAFQAPPLQELEPDRGIAEIDAGRQPLERSFQELERTRQRYASLQEQIARLQRDQEQRAQEHNDLAGERDARLAEMADQFRGQVSELQLRQSLTGSVLSRIHTVGLSDEERKRLADRLPVKLGDRLSPELIEATSRAIRTFEHERLRFEFVPLQDNQSALEIAVADTYWTADHISEQLAELDRAITGSVAQLDMARRTYTERHPDLIALETRLRTLIRHREELEAQLETVRTAGPAPR